MAVERGITIAVETVQGHHAHATRRLEAKGMNRGKMAVFIDSRLTIERQMIARNAIVQASIQEIIASWIELTIDRRGLGL